MSDSGDDPWGWSQESLEENWNAGTGTDSRLGIRGRHTFRSAWICANWGGGISPTAFVSAGAGLPTMGRKKQSVSTMRFSEDEGLDKAEAFLLQTLIIAEKKGIRIPDLAAMRAGVYTSTAEAASKPLDWTAVNLECKLASIRERLGSQQALKDALSGYTRVYDVLSHVEMTNRAMHKEGHESGRGEIQSERLVRLATKIGNLHSHLGQQSQAEEWLLQAVNYAGLEASQHHEEKGRDGIVRHQIMAGIGGLAAQPAEVVEAIEATHDHTPKESLKHATHIPTLLSSDSPSPALTRSLISTLLSLSAFYAQPEDRHQLERAVQFQASALRLARVEKERVQLSDNRDQLGSILHALWLSHHDALACIHIAETTFALRNRGTVSSSFGNLMSSVGLGTKKGRHEQTLQWLNEADQNAKSILQQLSKSFSRPDEDAELLKRWKGEIQYEVPAKRLLRDSRRLKVAVEEMKKVLA